MYLMDNFYDYDKPYVINPFDSAASVPLATRVSWVRGYQKQIDEPVVLIPIHANAWTKDLSVNGFVMRIRKTNPTAVSKIMAGFLLNEFKKLPSISWPYRTGHIIQPRYNKPVEQNLTLLSRHYHAAHVEAGFFTNKDDREYMESPCGIEAIAHAIIGAIQSHRKFHV
jgi:N-acetylmuramoyl-L-alanine amidase